MRLLWSPSKEDLLSLISEARESVDLAVAYISPGMVSELLERLRDGVRLRVLTRLDGKDFRSGIAKLSTFRRLGRRVQVIRNLHAKLYIVDEKRAVLGSANLTEQGLSKNMELGVLIEDASLLGEICDRYNSWWEQSEPVNYRALANQVRKLPKGRRDSNENERAISAMAPVVTNHQTGDEPLKALAQTEPGMRLPFDFLFTVGETFLDCGERHVIGIRKKHFRLVDAERLTDIDSVDVLLPDGSIMRGSIQLTHDKGIPRYRIRVGHDHSCTIRDHLQIGQRLHIEVSRDNGTVRVDLRPEEGS